MLFLVFIESVENPEFSHTHSHTVAIILGGIPLLKIKNQGLNVCEAKSRWSNPKPETAGVISGLHRERGKPRVFVHAPLRVPPPLARRRAGTTPESWRGSPKVNSPTRQLFSKVEISFKGDVEAIYPLHHSGVVHQLLFFFFVTFQPRVE